MSIGRRGFLYAGGLLTAGPLFTAAQAAAAATAIQSVTDFGVEPNASGDQTAALQKAMNELARAGQPVVLPAGKYLIGSLKLPPNCTIIGTAGLTTLLGKGGEAMLSGARLGAFHLTGVAFARANTSKNGAAALAITDTAVSIAHCRLEGLSIKLEGCSGSVEGVEIAGSADDGLLAARAAGLTISRCRVSACEAAGITVSGAAADLEGFTVAQNQIAKCGIGIAADGTGIVNGNIVTGATRFGLRLGRGAGDGYIMAQSNLIRGARIGIGVTASGDNVLASLNLINGAKDGAIRAFDGETLVGPDLARKSAEAYLNLMVAGNVAR